MIGTRSFRLYRNRDVTGVELCGALKNIIAIAAGAAEHLGFGDNGKAGIITRGLAEMTRLGIAAGANPLTFAGLAGLGDVIATCYSTAVAQPRAGRGAGQGPQVAGDRGHAAGRGGGAYTVTSALEMAASSAWRCRSRRRSQRAVRGQERPALPDRPALARAEGRTCRLRGVG